MKTTAKQLAYVRDWEKRHPEQAQARKNAWWKTPKGKAAVKRRRKKFNAYRRKWRAERAKAKAANAGVERQPGSTAPKSKGSSESNQ